MKNGNLAYNYENVLLGGCFSLNGAGSFLFRPTLLQAGFLISLIVLAVLLADRLKGRPSPRMPQGETICR